MTRRAITPEHTPPDLSDLRQPRESAVRCPRHLHMPTWRRDMKCQRCLDEAS